MIDLSYIQGIKQNGRLHLQHLMIFYTDIFIQKPTAFLPCSSLHINER